MRHRRAKYTILMTLTVASRHGSRFASESRLFFAGHQLEIKHQEPIQEFLAEASHSPPPPTIPIFSIRVISDSSYENTKILQARLLLRGPRSDVQTNYPQRRPQLNSTARNPDRSSSPIRYPCHPALTFNSSPSVLS